MQKREPVTVHAALSFPTATSNPSHRCLQWSADGQLCLVTKNAVIILTPDHGINFDADSAVKVSPSGSVTPFGWFKTMIEHAQIETFKWPDYSQAWGAVSLGSLDLCVTSLAISPSGLSANGGCIFATLSSNMDLNFWAVGKNYLKGEYAKVNEVTPFLQKLVATTEEGMRSTANVLKAQVVSIEWTPQPDFNFKPSPCLDASLFVAGTRAGELVLLKYQLASDPEHLVTLQVADTWITQIAFAKWKWNAINPIGGRVFELEGYLAYANSDGAIGLVKVTQVFHEMQEAASFTPQYQIELRVERIEEDVFAGEPGSGPAGVTALKWVGGGVRHEPILFASTPGMFKFWCRFSSTSSSATCTRTHTLRLPTHTPNRRKISADASSLHPVSGVSYLEEEDRLVVVLFDGSVWVVGGLRSMWSTEQEGSELEKPCWILIEAEEEKETHSVNGSKKGKEKEKETAQSGGLNSEALSSASRMCFASLENERREKENSGTVDKWDMCRINGAVGYDEAGVIVWAYESARPSDFSYKQDSQHSSTVVVSKMWSDSGRRDLGMGEDGGALLRDLRGILSSVKASSSITPLHTLRAFFFHLREPNRLERLHQGFLEILGFRPEDSAVGGREGMVIPSFPGLTEVFSLVDEGRMDVDLGSSEVDERTTKIRENLRLSLSTHLFGWDELLRLRMRLSLADFAWKLSTNEHRQAECGVVAQALLNAISYQVLRTIIRHVCAVVGLLGINDVPFASRLIVQSLLPGCPLDLVEEGKNLSVRIQPLLAEAKSISTAIATTSSSSTLSTTEVTATTGRKGTEEPLVPSAANIITQLIELCPACGVEVPLEDITSAVCQDGHTWARCSVTTFILSTPWVRTCVGCSRKAFLPPSAHVRSDGQRDLDQIPLVIAQGGWVVEELLEAVKRCLFCGNRFVRIL